MTIEERKRERGILLTSSIGIGGNLLLVVAKLIIGLLSFSASIISDAINNLTDALSSLITAVGTKLSNKRPNKKHPFGYGRIEYLTATIVAALILFAGGTAIYESITSLVNQEQSKYELVSFIVIGIAIIAKLGLGVFFRVRAKKLSSLALKNSGTDALFDAILSTGTFIAMFISYYANVYIEGYIGILIGLFIIKSGISAMIESLSPILGERIDDKLAAEIKSEICTHPEVKGAYDLIVNSYGENKRIGSVHVEVDDKLTIQEFHSIERQIQIYMYDKHGIIMTIGVYASNDSSPKAKELKAWALKCCGEEKDIIQVHGFYFDDEQRFVTLDIIVNFDSKEEPQDIANRVKNKIEAQYPELAIYVNIDQDFSN